MLRRLLLLIQHVEMPGSGFVRGGKCLSRNYNKKQCGCSSAPYPDIVKSPLLGKLPVYCYILTLTPWGSACLEFIPHVACFPNNHWNIRKQHSSFCRPSMYTMLADLVHHVRAHLSYDFLCWLVTLF